LNNGPGSMTTTVVRLRHGISSACTTYMSFRVHFRPALVLVSNRFRDRNCVLALVHGTL
jgi:hypothetical protein